MNLAAFCSFVIPEALLALFMANIGRTVEDFYSHSARDVW